MFHALSRKRTLPGNDEETKRHLHRRSTMPLNGVVVCISGLPADDKTKLHQQVYELGGTFTRDLDTSQTTHLITIRPDGAKYDTAKSCPHICIVGPEWIKQTAETGMRAKEEFHYLTDIALPEIALETSLDILLKSDERSKLFASCKCYLIGFEEESTERLKLSKLIRRGMGTNYWDLNEIITHIIVNDECEDILQDASRTVTLYHPNGPAYMSPRWVVESWKAQQLQPPHRFEPRKRKKIIKPASGNLMTVSSRQDSMGLFRGTIFCIIRIAPPEGCADWNTEELESTICSHGGQMLSLKVLDALRSDQSKHDTARRTVYVVSWGGYSSLHASLHPMLAHIQKENLCSVVPVSPVWLKTVIVEQRMAIPNRRPILFQPQAWPFAMISKSIQIAVTGFAGSERTGMMHLIQAMGATYTANLKPQNTHVICKESKGPKYIKAIEWKVHTVTVEWLYHVARYGFLHHDGSIEKRFGVTVGGPVVKNNRDEPNAN
jgi:twin BRCT domain